MAKSHAQRQKEYRDRKKAEASSSWLENESRRTKQYYTKVGLLSKKEAKDRRQKLRQKQRKYRASKTGTGIGVSLSDKKDHICIQMDFSENYSIKEMEEIQSAYWNPESVTLHPIVMYFNNGDNGVTHSSMVAVSEVLNHNSAMVQAIIAKLIVEVKSLCPAAKFIHYWTDSPTSQYRNKTMFDLVARHQNVYGMKASWNLFESGHGKGACYGIGGVVKRTADTVIETGKVSIHRGRDFYEWGSKIDSKIKYLYIDREEYEESNKLKYTQKMSVS